jgi:hypothetical protein
MKQPRCQSFRVDKPQSQQYSSHSLLNIFFCFEIDILFSEFSFELLNPFC